MNSKKYIGMDVHQASICVAVRDEGGKIVMESILETKAATILSFLQGIAGNLWITFEEGTSAAWLSQLNGTELSGRVLTVNEARPKPGNPVTGLGGQRSGGRGRRW
jgi:hypothetical protein